MLHDRKCNKLFNTLFATKWSRVKNEKYEMFLENTVNPKEQFGWIEVICGSMFSGKTEELIRRLKRAKIAQQKVEIFKPVRPTL